MNAPAPELEQLRQTATSVALVVLQLVLLFLLFQVLLLFLLAVDEQEKVFGVSIEPEKEIVLTVARARLIDKTLEEIVGTAQLNETGRGIAFIVPVDNPAGVAPFMKRDPGPR